MNREQVPGSDTVSLSGIWRYRWLVLVIVVAAGAASVALARTQQVSYTASASLVIEDPRSSSLFGSLAGVSPTRYLADQVAILQSGAVAVRAAAITAEAGFADLDASTLLEDARVAWTDESNLVVVRVRASSPEAAIAGANALADAYRDVRRSESIRSTSSAMEQLEEKISVIDQDVDAIQTRIDELRSAGILGAELGEEYQAALDRLITLYSGLRDGSLSDDERQELTDLSDQFITIQRIAGLETDSSELTALEQELVSAISRRSALQTRRDQIEIDAELEADSVSLFSPAIEAAETGADLRLFLTVGVFLGLLAGMGLAYLLASRRRTFGGRLQPESVLRAPLLAEIPNFREEGLKLELPVRDAPSSASAEAFRFAVAGIEIQAATPRRRGSPGSHTALRSLAIVSGRVGDGKTTIATNLALAAARRGSRVLVVDADFGAQRLTSHLSQSGTDRSGITDIVELGERLEAVVERVDVASGVQVELLSRGTVNISIPDFFRSAAVRDFFDAARGEYDLVLVDTAPILQAAYAAVVARYVDRVAIVVPHGSKIQLLEDVRNRLDLVGTPVSGYLYNRAPLRREITGSEGSMKDVLGSREAADRS